MSNTTYEAGTPEEVMSVLILATEATNSPEKKEEMFIAKAKMYSLCRDERVGKDFQKEYRKAITKVKWQIQNDHPILIPGRDNKLATKMCIQWLERLAESLQVELR